MNRQTLLYCLHHLSLLIVLYTTQPRPQCILYLILYRLSHLTDKKQTQQIQHTAPHHIINVDYLTLVYPEISGVASSPEAANVTGWKLRTQRRKLFRQGEKNDKSSNNMSPCRGVAVEGRITGPWKCQDMK